MYNRLPSFLCLIIFGQQLPTGFGMLVMWLPSDFSVLSFLQIVDLIKKEVSPRVRCSPWDEIRNVWSSSSVLCSVDSMDNIIFFP